MYLVVSPNHGIQFFEITYGEKNKMHFFIYIFFLLVFLFMIPQFEEIRIQALKELSSGSIMRAKELRIPLAKHFQLTEEEMNAWYPSGNGEIFLD